MISIPAVLGRSMIAAAIVVSWPVAAPAQEMPPAAKKIIKKLKIPADVVAGWEKEHQVPAAWLEGAKKEPELKINGSWSPKEFDAMVVPFRERYPFVKINYSRGSNSTRVRVPLIAFKEGRIVTDIITGIDSSILQFRKADALADLSDMPNLGNVPDGMGSPAAKWAGARVRYWCFAYNPTLIPAADMPKRWEDLLTTARLKDGKLALWRGATSWLLPLWGEKGDDWVKNFSERLYADVKPQRRKEGARALVNLVVAGEFNATLAAAAYQVRAIEKKGAPVAFHCPDVVPVTISSIGILKGSPHIHGAKLFLNWLLSKEGQLAQYAADGAAPVHKALIERNFMPYPAAIKGKKIAFRNPELLGDDLKQLLAFWNALWEAGPEVGSARSR